MNEDIQGESKVFCAYIHMTTKLSCTQFKYCMQLFSAVYCVQQNKVLNESENNGGLNNETVCGRRFYRQGILW